MNIRITQVADAEISHYPITDEDLACGQTGDMYVMEVHGVSLLIRLRAASDGAGPEVYVHIDNESREQPCALTVEVCNNGGSDYTI